MGLGREARHVAYRAYDPGGQYWTYAEDFGKGGAASSTSASMRLLRSAIFLSSVRMSRRTSRS